jgi:uncharacterized protein (TIGR02453 family)
MPAPFPGFSPEAMRFLRALKRNNDREWFQPRKEQYEALWKAPMTELAAGLHREMAKFAPEYVQDPAKAVARIYRDTRFRKDKTPYKTHVSAVFRRRGLSKNGSAQFYFHVDPTEVVMAGGCYMPGPDELRAIRMHLAEHHEAFGRLCRAPKVKAAWGELQGEQLTRPPKGFPDLELLRNKQFYFSLHTDSAIATTPQLFTELLTRLRAATPVMDFLNQPLLGLVQADESRFVSDGLSW